MDDARETPYGDGDITRGGRERERRQREREIEENEPASKREQ
jgi:hypothetical protein